MRNDLNGILADIQVLDAQLSELKDKKDNLQKQVNTLIGEDIRRQLAANDYGCGTATIETEEYKIKAVVAKKVDWDQPKLAELYERIKASGDNPGVYMKAEFKVSETAFKTWPTAIQDALLDAREVSQSKPTLKIERKA